MEEKHYSSDPVYAGRPPGAELPKPSRHWPWILAGVFVFLLILGIVAFFTHRQSAQGSGGGGGRHGGATTVMISTATAQRGNMNVYVEALGNVTPVYTVSLDARVAGQIDKVEYSEGQEVHTGDPLVEIDPRPYQAAVLEEEGQLKHDEALLDDAKIDLARYKNAYDSNAIPEQQYATQNATVQEDEGSVELDQGNLSNALVNLAYCHVTSPITGRVGLRLVDPGNIVQANGTTPLVIIAQIKPITVIFDVAEDDLPKVLAAVHKEKGLTMDIYDREDQTKITTGKLETLDNEIAPSTGTLKLRGVCSNEDESLFPGQFVNVHLLVNTLRDITLLPNSAIQRNSESAYVYLVSAPANGQTNQTVKIQNITVGVTDGTNSEVQEMSPGDMVASDNFNRLTDGAKVVLRPASGEGAGGQGKGHKKNSQ